MNFLSESHSKEATASVLADRPDTRVVKIPFDRIYQTLIQDYGLSRRFFLNICTVLAGRYQKVVFQKTGAYVASEEVQMPLAVAQSEPELQFSPEALSLLGKVNMQSSEAVAEYPCKMKGKIGKGHLLICQDSIFYFSRATGLFGHFSKTIIPADSVVRVQEEGNSLFIEYGGNKLRHVEIQFYSQPHLKQALIYLAPFTGRGASPPSQSHSDAREAFNLTKDDWALLTKNQSQTACAEGEIVVKSGSFALGLYQVVKGSCRIEYQVGERRLSFSIKTGEIFGEVPFILGTVTGSTLVAASAQTVVRIISHRHLNRTLSKKPSISSKLYLFLARTLRSRFLRVQNSLLRENTEGDSKLLTKEELAKEEKAKEVQPPKKKTRSTRKTPERKLEAALSHMGRTVPLKPLKQESAGRGRSASRGNEEESTNVVQLSLSQSGRRKSWGIDSIDNTLKTRFDLSVQSLSLNSDGTKEPKGSLTSRERSRSVRQPNKQEISREQVMTWKKVDKPQGSPESKKIQLQSNRV